MPICEYCNQDIEQKKFNLHKIHYKKKQETSDTAAVDESSVVTEVAAKKIPYIVLNEFNEPRDMYEQKLKDAFLSANTVEVRFKRHLTHEFIDIAGQRSYSIDNILNIFRNECESFVQQDIGNIQCFICNVKKV